MRYDCIPKRQYQKQGMGCGASVTFTDEEWKAITSPQLSIDVVLPLLSVICHSKQSLSETLDKLEEARLLPHNSYDLLRSFGFEGRIPKQIVDRGTLIEFVKQGIQENKIVG